MTGTYIRDDQGRRIYVPDDMRRIDGLKAEDKIRTLTLFRPGNFADHPTAPIDIAPFHDLLQGIGTHAKSILQSRSARQPGGFTQGTLEMASTYEAMRLTGHHRYFILAYELDGEIEIDGKFHKIRRYHTAIEAIASPTTFAAFRGDYTLEHLAWIQRRLDDYQPTHQTIEYQQERFKKLMAHFKPFFGIAKPSVKLSMNSRTGKVDNKRIQSSIPLVRVQNQLMQEGPYRGRFTQPNYREWYEGEIVYGMKLPWFTISTDRIFSTIGDPAQPLDAKAEKAMEKRRQQRTTKRKIAPPSITTSSSDDSRYAAENPIKQTMLSFKDGMITVIHQQDDARTIAIDSVDPDAFKRANDICKELADKWLPVSGRWLANVTQTKRIIVLLKAQTPVALPDIETDYVDELPPVPDVDPLRPHPANDRLFYYDVGDKSASALLLAPYGNWALLPSDHEIVNEQIDAACTPYAPLKSWDGRHDGNWTVRYNAERSTWIVRDDPKDLIKQVVAAIQNWKK